MNAIRKILGWKFSNEWLDSRFAMLACIIGGLCIMGLGFRKLATMHMSDTEAFFGILLVLSVALQMISLGFLIQTRGSNPG